MKKLFGLIAYQISWWLAYGFTWFEMHWHDVDVYLFALREMHIEAADSECRKYDCERALQVMRLNRKYGNF